MSRFTSVIAIATTVILVLLTCINVLGTKFFKWSVPDFTGTLSLDMLVAMSFAMGLTYLAGMHIKVELLLNRLPGRFRFIIESIINFLGFALFILMIWQLVVLGRSFQLSGETTLTKIPLAPFVYIIALGFVLVCLSLLYQLGISLSKIVRK